MEKVISIAIDGPAAAGKSTVAKLVAQKLSYLYIDTGAMYRSLTYRALESGIGLDDEEALARLLDQTEIELIQNVSGQKVLVNGVDFTTDIRSDNVTNNVSYIAKHSVIREEMVRRQQGFANNRSVVMDGRDIGTHVLPNASAKFFLIATAEERARRRYEENKNRGFSSDFDELKREIEKRDVIDSEREVAPLIKATDAIEIDTTSMSIQEVANFILSTVQETLD